jgi:arylsulfatase A-like enzyme
MNILIIMADQHRADCMGAYGNRDIRTPHMDSLAADGVLFENSFCSAPVCTPSRYSFLTGLYVHQHLGWSNRSTIPGGLDTFPQLLRQAGYQTKAIGKMHFTPTYLDVGFGEMELAEQDGDGRYEDDYHAFLMSNSQVDYIDLIDQVQSYRDQAPSEYWDSFGAMESNLPEAMHSTGWIGRNALDAIERWDSGKQLLMVSFIKPHHPFDPPTPWSRMYNPERLTLLPGWTEACPPQDVRQHPGFFSTDKLTEERLKHVMAYYYGSISQIDHYVGAMINKLKQKAMYDDTLILYTSDHGEYMGFHHLLTKGNHMYDPLAKVPLIIKFPGGRNAGTRRTDLVSNIDIAPTLLTLAGCVPGTYMAGENIGEGAARRAFVFAENARGWQYMLRTATRKLLLNRNRERSLYFDLEEDPYEMRNVIMEERYQSEIAPAIERLYTTVLFDAVSPIHTDVKAPEIQNKRSGIDRLSSERYFKQQMNRRRPHEHRT